MTRRRSGAKLVAPIAAIALVAVAAGAVAALVPGERSPVREGEVPSARDPAVPASSVPGRNDAGPALGRQVGQLLLVRFRGTAAPPYARRILRHAEAAGVVLFADNVDSPPQLRALTREVQRESRGSALVCVDQEGGPIRNVPFAGSRLAPTEQRIPVVAGLEAERSARELRALGVTVTLGPVADIPTGPGSVMSARAYPGSPTAVAAAVKAALAGYHRGRVAAAVKHFPGLGAATVLTDDAPATVPRARHEIEHRDLEPFRGAIAEGAPLVMASHAVYPTYDGARIASQSPVLLEGLLRQRLGFRGAIVTDSLEADAVLRRSSVEEAAVRSVEAGADLLLMTSEGSYRRVHRRLLDRARRSSSFRRRVREAAGRVATLKLGLGLAPAGTPRG